MTRVSGAVRIVAFWLAILLPLSYPLVLVDGGAIDLFVFCGLLDLHAAALSVGHSHRSD
jgi:hypothetical protein